MVESFTLPLRPPQEQNERPDTLPVEIAQINNQWGSFREVNEEVLLAKIAEEERLRGVPEEEDKHEVGETDATERREQLYKRRHEIVQFAMFVLIAPRRRLKGIQLTNASIANRTRKPCSLSISFPCSCRSMHRARPKLPCLLCSSNSHLSAPSIPTWSILLRNQNQLSKMSQRYPGGGGFKTSMPPQASCWMPRPDSIMRLNRKPAFGTK